MWLGPSTKCYIDEIWFVQVLTRDKMEYKSTVVSVRSAMVCWFCVRPASKRWVFENSPSDQETWSIRYHLGIHVKYTSTLHSHTPLVPQVYCAMNLDRLLRLSHQWECLTCNGHGLSISCVKWPLAQIHETMALMIINSFYFNHVWGLRMNRNSTNLHSIEGPITYDFTSHLRACDHPKWHEFGSVLGRPLGHFFGLSRFDDHGSLGWCVRQWSGRFLGIIIGWDPSVCKSNGLQVDILRFSLIKLWYIL